METLQLMAQDADEYGVEMSNVKDNGNYRSMSTRGARGQRSNQLSREGLLPSSSVTVAGHRLL